MKTLTPPPSILTSYLPALLLASNTLLEHCSQDPTAYGISTAFLESSAQLESALVAYCGIIGDIFATKRTSKRKLVRSRRSSVTVDESNQAPPSNDSNAPRNLGRKSLNPPSPPQLSFALPDRRKTIPMMAKSSLDVSRPFPIAGATSLPAPPLPTENGLSSQGPKTTLRRSFSLFRRKTYTSPAPASSISVKSSWYRFRSSSKTLLQGSTNPNEPIESLESPPRYVNQMPPRPTRPVPPIPQEPPPVSELGELDRSTYTPWRHDRRASLQETPIPSTESSPPTGWNTPNFRRRGGASLDLNHVIRSVESSTRSSHNLLYAPGERREKVSTVRDLAILPPQRVMRYVMLFRG